MSWLPAMESRRAYWSPTCKLDVSVFSLGTRPWFRSFSPSVLDMAGGPWTETWSQEGFLRGKKLKVKTLSCRWDTWIVTRPSNCKGGKSLVVQDMVSMGKDLSKAEKHHLQLLRHLPQTAGAQVKEEPLTQLPREVVKYNLWFTEEGTLDIENWDPVGENLKTAHRRGDCIPVMVFVTWGLVQLVLYPIQTEIMWEDGVLKRLVNPSTPLPPKLKDNFPPPPPPLGPEMSREDKPLTWFQRAWPLPFLWVL